VLLFLLRKKCSSSILVLGVMEHECLLMLRDGSTRVAMHHMRALKTETEPEIIMDASRMLEQENARVAQAAISRLHTGGVSHPQAAQNLADELQQITVSALATRLASNPHDGAAQKELDELNVEILAIMADLELTLTVEVSSLLGTVNEALSADNLPEEKLTRVVGQCESAMVATRKVKTLFACAFVKVVFLIFPNKITGIE
jgi:hypothetical protein